MKAPKFDSKLATSFDGWMVGRCGQMLVTTSKPLWAETFNAYALKNSASHRQALQWAIEEFGEANLKWLPLNEVES